MNKKLVEWLNNFIKKFSDWIWILAGMVLAIFLVNVFLLSEAFRGYKIDAENASQYGSFIGGYIGCILSFLSVVILIITLKEQRKSNFIEKFENKYFEMIKIHRENVSEISIDDSCGRKVFVTLIREFRVIEKELRSFLIKKNLDFEVQEIYGLAYCIFFYGTGWNSSRILNSALKRYGIPPTEDFIEFFEEVDKRCNVERDGKKSFKYTICEGHQSRLGHYYRHLYQSVTYVDKQEYLIMQQKKDYVKILRAQLSNHEQALLFINSLSYLGQNWKDEKLIEKYNLIKNLPKEFFDSQTEINVQDIYEKIDYEYLQ